MAIKSLLHSSLSDNRFYRSMLVGNTAYEPTVPAYELLQTETLTGTQATITFSSLNSTYGSSYQHLQFRMSLRTNRGSQPLDTGIFNINGVGSGYNNTFVYGYNGGITASSSASAGRIEFGVGVAGSTNVADVFSGHIIDIYDAFDSTKFTTTRSTGGVVGNSGTTSVREWFMGLFNNTAAVDSITFDAIGDFVSGSRISLYGLKVA